MTYSLVILQINCILSMQKQQQQQKRKKSRRRPITGWSGQNSKDGLLERGLALYVLRLVLNLINCH